MSTIVGQIAAAANGAWQATAFNALVLVGWALFYLRSSMTKPARLLCFGVAISAIGVLLHRGFWIIADWRDGAEMYVGFSEYWRLLPVVFVAMIAIGATIATHYYGLLWIGKWWWVFVFASFTFFTTYAFQLAA